MKDITSKTPKWLSDIVKEKMNYIMKNKEL